MRAPRDSQSSISTSISLPHAQISAIRLPTDARELDEPHRSHERPASQKLSNIERHGEKEHRHERQTANKSNATAEQRICGIVMVAALRSSQANQRALTLIHKLPKVRGKQ